MWSRQQEKCSSVATDYQQNGAFDFHFVFLFEKLLPKAVLSLSGGVKCYLILFDLAIGFF